MTAVAETTSELRPISRDEARTQGLTRYFTGKPCRRGHVGERYANGGACVVCEIGKQKARRAARKSGQPFPKSRRRKTGGKTVDDLTGRVFQRLLVLERAPNRGHMTVWHCLCAPEHGGCGNKATAYGGNLRSGHTKSCGCFRTETIAAVTPARVEDLTGQTFG